MTKFQEATPVTLTAPILGVNAKVPLASMPSGYSPWIVNADCDGQKIKVRNGYVIHCVVGASNLDIFALGTWGSKGASSTNKLFAYCNDGTATHKIYDVSTSTESLSDTLADNDASRAFPLSFAKRLIFSTNTDWADCNDSYDGSSWADWTFTYSGSPVGGDVVISYKSRVYMFLGTNMYYGDLEAVGGATSLLDLSTVFEQGGSICWASLLSNPGERTDEIYLAIGNIAGEILIYGGDYPADSTWQLVGRYEISEPIGYNAVNRYRNDTFIITDTGIVSLRDLSIKGSIAAEDLTISSNIDSYWTKLVENFNLHYWNVPLQANGVFWPERNQILYLVKGHIDSDGVASSDGATMCVYHTINEAWTFHRLTNVDPERMGGLTYYAGNIYFFVQNTIMTVDLDGYKDEQWDSPGTYAGFDYEIQGAHDSFGDSVTYKKVVAIVPLIKTDFTGTSVGVRAVGDFGLSTSDVAQVELMEGHNKPYYSVGAQGTYLQYRIEGTSDVESEDGLEIYAVSMVIIAGGRN